MNTRPSSLIALGALGVLPLVVACSGRSDGKNDTDGNEAPTLTIDRPVQDAVYEPHIDVSGFAADAEDAASALTLAFTDSLDGNLGTVTLADDGTFVTAFDLTEGAHTLTATVVDSGGADTAIRIDFTVTAPANEAPTLDTLIIDPAAPRTGDTLVASATASDADGDDVTVTYTWVEATTGATAEGDTVPDVARGQSWTVTAVANDGTVDSEPVQATVDVTNSAPQADGVVVTPAAGTPDDTFTCAVTNPVDPEGDAYTVTYRWLVDGVELATGDTLSPDLSVGLVKHAGLVCEATLDDGDTNVLLSDTVDVQDRAPDAPVVTLTPEDPGADEDVTCAAVATDVDGDLSTYTYSWWIDGVDSGYTGATLPASATTRDEVWTCLVTADDGDGGTSTGLGTVTIDITFRGTGSAADADVTIDGQQTSGAFAKTIALVGDTDGDGASELLVGANGEGGGGGTMYVFDGVSLSGALTTGDALASWSETESSAHLGGYRAVNAPGDLDGDGLSELLFAAAESNSNGDDAGKAYLMYGGSGWSGAMSLDAADWTLVGSVNDQLGARLTAGDFDGDGVGDIVVAAPGASDSNRESGTVSIFYGTGSRFSGAAVASDADVQIYGEDDTDELGWTTRFVGDVTGDGIDDLFTASIYDDDGASNAGMGALIPGGSLTRSTTLTDAASTLFTGDGAEDRFGYDTIGFDADQDGVNDLLVGEYQDDTAGAEAGAVRVYFGTSRWASAYAPTDADHTVYGGAAGDRFAHMMEDAGDVDGDGTSDLLIGALFADPDGRSLAGSAYLACGSDLLDASSANDLRWRRDGEVASDLFGDALAFGSGDVNADGVNDMVIGAQGYDGGATSAGRVYLWFGKP